jgi:hypothetical protein
MKLASLKHGRDGRLVVVFGHVGPSWTAPAAEATAGVQASLMSDRAVDEAVDGDRRDAE